MQRLEAVCGLGATRLVWRLGCEPLHRDVRLHGKAGVCAPACVRPLRGNAGRAEIVDRLLGLVLAGSLLVASTAWADPPPSAANAKAAKVNQRVAQHQAEVQRLQKDVSQQESASRQAAARLQQQDRAIAALRQQLKAAQEAGKTPPDGH